LGAPLVRQCQLDVSLGDLSLRRPSPVWPDSQGLVLIPHFADLKGTRHDAILI